MTVAELNSSWEVFDNWFVDSNEILSYSGTTHDAITYSQKAQTHKYVHPYLRYGILIGNRKHYPLHDRLFL